MNFATHPKAMRITITEAKGSTPRAAGTSMVVTQDQQMGTIGGGALEWQAINHARALLAGTGQETIQLTLGPQINQCCGGQVTLHFAPTYQQSELSPKSGLKPLYLFGAGHTGAALAHKLAGLPIDLNIIDTRAEWLNALPAYIIGKKHHLALPEAIIQDAPSGAAYIIMTHDHDLDFQITSAALGQEDASYVGMIGSKTKRARFVSWCKDQGIVTNQDRLICPLGTKWPGHKEPEVIALSIANQIMEMIITKEIKAENYV